MPKVQVKAFCNSKPLSELQIGEVAQIVIGNQSNQQQLGAGAVVCRLYDQSDKVFRLGLFGEPYQCWDLTPTNFNHNSWKNMTVKVLPPGTEITVTL